MSSDDEQRGRIESQAGFTAAAREMLAQVDAGPARDIVLVDPDFSPWPLDDADVLAGLTRWIRLPGRRLRLIGSRFDLIERNQNRFASWRRPFAHAMECLRPVELEPGDVPGLLLLDTGSLELLDRERWLARGSSARRTLVLQRERVDALLQRCEPAWPVTVLGL